MTKCFLGSSLTWLNRSQCQKKRKGKKECLTPWFPYSSSCSSHLSTTAPVASLSLSTPVSSSRNSHQCTLINGGHETVSVTAEKKPFQHFCYHCRAHEMVFFFLLSHFLFKKYFCSLLSLMLMCCEGLPGKAASCWGGIPDGPILLSLVQETVNNYVCYWKEISHP